MPKHTVFFLGNGAAIAEMSQRVRTSELLAEALQEFRNDTNIESIRSCVGDIFSIRSWEEKSVIPTFEEVLTFIDVLLQKKEQVSGKWPLEKLIGVRDKMTYLLYRILDSRLLHPRGFHEMFVQKLFKKKNDCNKYMFMTLNYDVLLDNPLVDLRDNPKLNFYLDFGIDIRNFALKEEQELNSVQARRYRWDKPIFNKSILLLKLHGSLSWLYCPSCNEIIVTPKEKGVKYIYDPQVYNDDILKCCAVCGSRRKPVLVPPTWQKEYINPNLVQIWLRAERTLQKADEIFFIGYSLPESDVNVRYLLRKGLYRKNCSVRVNIINNAEHNSEERKRYERMFGSSLRFNNKISFEDFVETLDKFVN